MEEIFFRTGVDWWIGGSEDVDGVEDRSDPSNSRVMDPGGVVL